VIDYRNWQLPLGRRFRSLKIWFVLRSFGAQGFRAHLRKVGDRPQSASLYTPQRYSQGITLSNKFSDLVKASSQFELVVPPSFALTVFRLTAPKGNGDLASLNAHNRIFHRRLSSSDLFLTQTDVNGTFCLRFAVGAVRTEEEHILAAWDVLCAEAGPSLEEWVKSLAPLTVA
jgi:aromatic-L-amino-acid decarboxylase